jgi:hypothetical protein
MEEVIVDTSGAPEQESGSGYCLGAEPEMNQTEGGLQ